MIIQVVSRDGFATAMRDDSEWSYEACDALYDYYNESGKDFRLDIVAIRCDWSEYTETELLEDYGTTELSDMIELSNGSYLVPSWAE